MENVGPRSYSRSVLRGYVTELRRAGLYDQVRARASAELATCMEDPHGVPAWLGPATLDELLGIVGGLRGRDGVGALSYDTMKGGGFKSVLEPIIQLSLATLGASPGSLFSRAETMVSVVMRGIELKWTPGGKSSGTVRMRCETPVPELSWAAWEGVCLWTCELAGTRGAVAAARPAPDGRSCEVDVSWEQRKP
jgi:hypothetical protein